MFQGIEPLRHLIGSNDEGVRDMQIIRIGELPPQPGRLRRKFHRNSRLTQAQFRQSATETIVEVQRAYWDLVFALQSLTIQNETLRDFRARLEVDRRRAGNGMLAAIEVVGTEARTAQSEEAVYGAVEDLTRAENALKNLIKKLRVNAAKAAALTNASSAVRFSFLFA